MNDITELLVGINLNNRWCVSAWDKDVNLVWSKEFDTEEQARDFYDYANTTLIQKQKFKNIH